MLACFGLVTGSWQLAATGVHRAAFGMCMYPCGETEQVASPGS